MFMKRINYSLLPLILILVCFGIVYGLKSYQSHINKVEDIISGEFDSSFVFSAEYTAGIKSDKNQELKILVLGNSISSGVIVKNIKDDYVNVLIRKISAKQNNRLVRAKVYNLANFERHYKYYDYNVLKPLAEYKPDIIIFQLGENYMREDDDLYFQRFVKLINYFGNDNLKIVTSPYWGQRRKNKLNENAALSTNSFYVDISNLFAYDKKTRADYKKKFDNTALGEHPGEYGMQRIAEEIFILINACMFKNLI